MTHNVGLRQEILNKTLDEVAHHDDGHQAHPCVICLDQISEPAITLPCKHASFDFVCIASWLQERPACPLCQASVTAVKYDLKAPQGAKIYSLPPPEAANPVQGVSLGAQYGRSRPSNFQRRRQRPQRPRPTIDSDDPILRRRHIYRHQLYSRRVGSNRLSRYTEITPRNVNDDPDLVSRARKWIRRELQVFEFLNPTPETTQASGGVATGRRANNAEFLLEYIIAILRTVDAKGSGGQAEELLQEFLGRENARLFLHELQAWLRSPYNSLQDWDRAVQYDESVEAPAVAAGATEAERPVGAQSTRDRRLPAQRRRDISRTGRVEKRESRNWSPRGRRNISNSRDSRVQHARRRYHPD